MSKYANILLLVRDENQPHTDDTSNANFEQHFAQEKDKKALFSKKSFILVLSLFLQVHNVLISESSHGIYSISQVSGSDLPIFFRSSNVFFQKEV